MSKLRRGQGCRYHANLNILLGAVRGSLKWAEVADIKAELDQQVAQLLGPKTEADLVKPDKKKGKVWDHRPPLISSQFLLFILYVLKFRRDMLQAGLDRGEALSSLDGHTYLNLMYLTIGVESILLPALVVRV